MPSLQNCALNNGKLQLVWFKWNTELLQQNPDNTTFQCKSYKFAIDFGELCEELVRPERSRCEPAHRKQRWRDEQAKG